MDYLSEYKKWCTQDIFDGDTKRELLALTDEKEIEDRFYKTLSFGTGGLRGIIGAGTNRMNFYTVGKATQGLANFINKDSKLKRVAIAYDSRHYSPEFALRSALILNANGIETFLFDSLRPTPELSFAVRRLNCTAGIVITASHNPPQYNGYKVYWSDGAQITAPKDRQIISEVNAVTDYSQIKLISKEEAEKSGLFHIIGKEIDDEYIFELKKLILNPDVIKKQAENIKIVYTPLHGTGNIPVRRVLRELGFKNVYVVKEQECPDGNFTTLDYPNPEDPKAFDYALRLAKEKDADIVLATDPDADRLGIYAKDGNGEYKPFTGNMSGLLIAEYELDQKQKKGLLPDDPKDGAIVTTIVSSKMAYDIAAFYGISVIEVLTGFKYIGEQIKFFEIAKEKNGGQLSAEKGAYEYEFGYEESYGCLVGTHSRDKDAVMAVTALCEAAAYYKNDGITLVEQMENIYKKYGYYTESLKSVTKSGADGAEKIESIIKKLRLNPPEAIGGKKVTAVRDYLSGVKRYMSTGKEEKINLPESNVLYFETENGWCCVRPSGTEPKIKFYFGAKADTKEASEKAVKEIEKSLLSIAEI